MTDQWRNDAEALAQALEHVLLVEVCAVRGDGHPAWVPVEAHEKMVDEHGGRRAVMA